MTLPVALRRLGPSEAGRPVLVLGPSLGTSSDTLWSEAGAALAEEFDVFAWDLPGHGQAEPAHAEFTVADLAESVLAALDSVTSGRFAYAGDSIGGAVGLQLLLDHPDRIAAATLLCTGARIGTPESWAERATLVRDHGTEALVADTPARWFAPGFPERRPDVAGRLIEALRKVDPESYAWACGALGAFDARDRLGEIDVPVLAVAGAHDVRTPVASLREIAEGTRGARLVVIDDAAHLAPAEAPARVACLIAAHSRDTAHSRGTGYDAGLRVRRAVLGAAHVDRATAATTDLTREFQELITRYAWGEIWTRPGLDRRSRSMITLTALIARGHHEELAMHLRAARTNGLTDEEIKEVLLQTAIYCGVPDANTAFRIAQRVLDEDA
jgi:3-oxoadipate enol-lactonase/4-carboxymuconolactone decarboxylase